MGFILRLYLTFGWAILIFILMVTPVTSDPVLTANPYDKLIHGFLFAIFAYLLAITFSRKIKNIFLAYLLSAILAISYAGLLELIQMHIRGRYASLNDFLADVIGAILAVIYVYLTSKTRIT